MPLMDVGIHDPVIITGTALDATGEGSVVVSIENEAGDYIQDYWPLSDAALEYTLPKLKAHGWDAAEHDYDFTPLNGGSESPLAGAKTSCKVVEQEWPEGSGNFKKKIAWIGRRGPKLMPEGEAKDFVATLRKRLMASAGPTKGNGAAKANSKHAAHRQPPPPRAAAAGGAISTAVKNPWD